MSGISAPPLFKVIRQLDQKKRNIWTFVPVGPVSQEQHKWFESWLKNLLQELEDKGILSITSDNDMSRKLASKEAKL